MFLEEKKIPSCFSGWHLPCPAMSWNSSLFFIENAFCYLFSCGTTTGKFPGESSSMGFMKGSGFCSLFHYVLLCLEFYHLRFSSQHFLTVIYIQMVLDSCSITCHTYLITEGEIFWYVLSKPFIEWSLVNDFDGMKEEKIIWKKINITLRIEKEVFRNRPL